MKELICWSQKEMTSFCGIHDSITDSAFLLSHRKSAPVTKGWGIHVPANENVPARAGSHSRHAVGWLLAKPLIRLTEAGQVSVLLHDTVIRAILAS